MTLRPYISWAAITLATAIAANLAMKIVAEFPSWRFTQNNISHPLSEDCKLVGTNEDLSAVVQKLNKHGEGTSQQYVNNRLTVQRSNIQCVVDFDPITHKSAKSEIVQLPTFDIRGI